MELESLSGESRSAASTPSPICGAPSQVSDQPLPAARPPPLMQVVQCWTKPEVHGSPVTDTSSVDVELIAICSTSSSYLTLDDDHDEGKGVSPQEKTDDCRSGDANSLLEAEDDEGDLRSNTSSVRIENVGDCHLSDASSFTEVDEDPNGGRHVFPQEKTDDCWLGDANSLHEAEDDESDLRSNTSSVRIENVGDCHLSDVSSFTEVDEDPTGGRYVFPQEKTDDCWLGDANSLLESEDDESDLRSNTSSVRIENVGDCHLSDASSFTEGDDDPTEGRRVFPQERSDDSRSEDANSLLEAEKVPNEGWNGYHLKTPDGHSLRNTASHRQALPLRQVLSCWEGPLVTKERDCSVPAEEDSVLSFYLQPEHHGPPVLDGDWADAPISTRQTPSPVLLQEGLQRRKGVCPWLRRLGNALRSLGKRKRTKQNESKEMGLKRFLSCFCCFK